MITCYTPSQLGEGDDDVTLSQCLFRNLLSRIGENDMNQIKLVFDSIDKNRDGQLSLSELEQFASNLRYCHTHNQYLLKIFMLVKKFLFKSRPSHIVSHAPKPIDCHS